MLNHRYELISEIFNGENSVKVLMCLDKATQDRVMIKSFPKSNFELSFFKHELDVNRIVEFDNIIKVLDYYETRSSYNLVMEAGTMDLFDYLVSKGPLKEVEFMKLFKGIAKAIDKMHERNVLHNDLKLENIVLMNDSLYLIDFGLSDILCNNTQNNSNNNMVGTTFYTAPEIIKDNFRSKKSDVYSFGVVMFIALTGEFPFDSDNSFIYTVQQLNNPPNLEALRDLQISNLTVDIIDSCLSIDPQQRPDMHEIVNVLWPDVQSGANFIENMPEI